MNVARVILLAVLFVSVGWTLRAIALPDPQALRSLRRFVRRGHVEAEAEEHPVHTAHEPLSRRLGRRLERLLRGGRLDRLEMRLRAADLNLRSGEFLLFVLALAGFGLLAGLVFAPLWALVAAPVLGAAPFALLAMRGQERARQIGQALPDALNSTANALRSGFSLLQALEATARQTPGALGQELDRLLSEARVGVPIDEALDNMSQRARSADLELVVTAIQIQRQIGGNLAEVLDRIQGTIRDRVRLQGEVRALTAQGRLSSLIVGLMPVGLLAIMLALSPTFVMPLFTTSAGHVFLVAAGVLEIIGFVLLRRIVKIEV